jgi:ABC-type Fe3+/spermidine/putrescine transport system ATPase subunit
VRLATAGGSRANRAPGRIEEVIFKGASTHYHIRLAGDCRCEVQQQNASDERTAARGQEVVVEWTAEDCLILGAEEDDTP